MTAPYIFAAIALVVAGIGVGWALATRRSKKALMRDFMSQAATGSVASGGRPAKVAVRTMEMKCGCGSVSKFRDPVEPGYLPFPDGDSFACPNCGRVRKLNEINRLVRDARG